MPQTWPFREHHFYSTVFYDLALKYDVMNGAPAFTDMPAANNFPVSFRLNEYLSGLAETPKRVNCYDQACIMMAVLALVHPIDSLAWYFMEPFGFIKTTVLIGQGACNNPFYEASPRYNNQPVCGRYAKGRSSFLNHVFVGIGVRNGVGNNKDEIVDRGNIVDACSGPHLGNETWQQYVSSSLDLPLSPRFGDVVRYKMNIVLERKAATTRS